ncbi:MAG: FtsX-like permease family protein [Acidobacteriota bacterium]
MAGTTSNPRGRGPRPTPLAWLSLTHDRRRFFASTAGVAFAILLMWVELGFLNAIYDSTTLPVEAFAADLIVVSSLKDNTNPSKPFPRSLLSRAAGSEGVAAAEPLYLSRWGQWQGHGTATQDNIRVVGIDPGRRHFKAPEINAGRRSLQRLDTALVDRRHRDSYGASLRLGNSGELNGHRIDIVGDFELGPGLEMNATLIVSDRTFARVFASPERQDPLQRVDYGLIRLDESASATAVKRALNDRLGAAVRVLSPDELIADIHRYWTLNKPVGAVFGLGVVVGFLIGVVICYQVLFTDVLDHLPQFATLVAMGYSARFLVRLAVGRGLLLAASATAAAAPVGWWAYGLLANLTGLTFRISAGRALLVASCAAAMCVLASLLAMRKALNADPAELF